MSKACPEGKGGVGGRGRADFATLSGSPPPDIEEREETSSHESVRLLLTLHRELELIRRYIHFFVVPLHRSRYKL